MSVDAATREDAHQARGGPAGHVVMGCGLYAIAVACGVFMHVGGPSREAIGLIAVVQMLALLFARVPVAMSMFIPGLVGLWAVSGQVAAESMLSKLPLDAIAKWTYSVVPMFILMGLLLANSGLTTVVYRAANHWIGWVPGGMAVATNFAGVGMAAMSGSAFGTVYSLGRIGIPEMLRLGYHKRLAIATIVVASLPAQLIPPSILLVVYAGMVETPIGPQLLAGIGPGVLVGLVFSSVFVLIGLRWPAWVGRSQDQVRPTVSWGERFKSLAQCAFLPLLILVVLGGMFSGTMTATEAGAAGAMVTLVLVLWVCRRDRPFKRISDASVATVKSSGAIFFLVIGIEAFSRMLSVTGIGVAFADAVTDLGLNRVEFLLVMLVVYLILGIFFEPLALLLLTVPVLIPTLQALDISLVWFGVFAVFMGEIAVITPPVGMILFIVQKLSREPAVNLGQSISHRDVSFASWLFVPLALLFAVVLILWPDLVLYIPNQMSE